MQTLRPRSADVPMLTVFGLTRVVRWQALPSLLSSTRCLGVDVNVPGTGAVPARAQSTEKPQSGDWCPRQESNLYLSLRRTPFYPLNYEDEGGGDFNSSAVSVVLHGVDPVSYTHLTLPTIYSV